MSICMYLREVLREQRLERRRYIHLCLSVCLIHMSTCMYLREVLREERLERREEPGRWRVVNAPLKVVLRACVDVCM